MEITEYKKFIKKYKKTNYISTKEHKRLTDLGLDFYAILEKISNAYTFLEKNHDSELLNDLLLYVSDDNQYIDHTNDHRISFSLRARSSDLNMIMPLKLDNLPNRIETADMIISEISAMKINKIKRYEFNLLEKYDSWNNYHLNQLLMNNEFDRLELNSVLSITFKVNNFDKVYCLSEYLKEETFSRYFDILGIENDFRVDYRTNPWDNEVVMSVIVS